MTEQSRLRRWLWLLAPILLSRFDKWCARRAKERQRAQRILDRMANPEAYEPPIEPRRDVNSVFLRMVGHRRQGWQLYADEISAQQRERLGRHHGLTRAADNLTRRG